MSDWRKKVGDALIAHAPLSQIIGFNAFAEVAPDSASFPFVVYDEVSRTPEITHDGDNRFDSVVIQVTSWHTTRDNAIALRELVRDALSSVAPGAPIVGKLVPQNLQTTNEPGARFCGASIDFHFYLT